MTGLAKTIGGNRMSKEKFPDNVVYNYETEEFDANIKPYGTNTAAPAIRPNDMSSIKGRAISAAEKYAEKEIDNYDRPIVPKLDKYLMITFDPDNSGKFLYSGDFRSINETNGTWNARITQRGPKVPVELTGRFTGPYPDDLHVSYVDIQKRLIYQ